MKADPEHWRRVERALDAVLDVEPARWPGRLDEVCGDDRDLRVAVEDLLSCFYTARTFLDSPPGSTAAALVEEAREATTGTSYVGRRIGAYRVLRELGRGGMSRVFLAERADGEFTQQVALKLLRPGLDTEIDHARFSAERQILARLNHPNIARLLDAGTTDDGIPYVVLEHVDGKAIDAHCQERLLDVRQRLELFLTMCEATNYAHRNLVVHRDLKPSNVLVSADGTVKLLDFGVAKLLEPSEGAVTAATRTGMRWMTPEYAAPEQVRREPVTTVTDVYQLGAILYELLTERLPFTGHTPHELDQAVLHEDPAAPSVAVAEKRPVLARQLKGDLDAIVLKAMRKEPEQRFPSVAAMMDDLRRYLTGHPVEARSTTVGYRMRRFVRRHRVETLAAAGILLSVLGATGISVVQARHARAERDRAALASRQSDATTAFVLRLFEASDPAETHGDTVTAADLVRRAAARAEQLKGEPAVQARMLAVTARLYRSLGKFNESYVSLERALALQRQAERVDGLEVASTLTLLTEARLSLGRHAAADSSARDALALREHALGSWDPAIAISLQQVARVAIFRGDLPEAERYYRRALAVQERALGQVDSQTANGYLLLGSTLRREGRLTEAERETRRGLGLAERALGPTNPLVADALLQVAYLLDEGHGRYAEAEPLYRRALQIRRDAFGASHPQTAYATFDLADLLLRRGDRVAASSLGQQYLAILRGAYGAEHPVVATGVGQVAIMHYKAGNLTEAEALFRQAIAMERRLRGDDHQNIAGHEMWLGRLLIDRGDFTSAATVLQDCRRIYNLAIGPNHPATAWAEALYASLLTHTSQYVVADSILRQSLRTIERQIGRQDQMVREMYGWLADVDSARGRREEAARYRAIAEARH